MIVRRLLAVVVLGLALAFAGAAFASFLQADGLSTADLIADWIALPFVLGLILTFAAFVAWLLWTGGPA